MVSESAPGSLEWFLPAGTHNTGSPELMKLIVIFLKLMALPNPGTTQYQSWDPFCKWMTLPFILEPVSIVHTQPILTLSTSLSFKKPTCMWVGTVCSKMREDSFTAKSRGSSNCIKTCHISGSIQQGSVHLCPFLDSQTLLDLHPWITTDQHHHLRLQSAVTPTGSAICNLQIYTQQASV